MEGVTRVQDARRILVLTGAGVSAESGVPTFRGGGGTAVWRGMPFEQLSSARMVKEDLSLVWEWFDYRRSVLKDCRPNPGHFAIADAQRSGRWDEVSLVTQNIDGLHRAAGSSDLIELHGHINEARCVECGNVISLEEIPSEMRPPICTECSGRMRPKVVLFGEALDEEELRRARDKAAECDVCIVAGTSAVVYPANQIPMIAKRAGAFVIEVNPESTPLSGLADISIRNTSAAALPSLLSPDPTF